MQANRNYKLPAGLRLFSPPVMLASLGGVGFLHSAPGTWASLFVLPLGLFILLKYNALILLSLTISLFLLGLWMSAIWLAHARKAQADGGDRHHDPQVIVIDELVGMWLALALMPQIIPETSLSFALEVIACFALFRVFDIIKPWPIRLVEQKISGAWGVMLDDVAAALLASLFLWALQLPFIFT